MLCGKESVIVPAPFVPTTWLAVPVRVARTKAVPPEPIRSWPLAGAALRPVPPESRAIGVEKVFAPAKVCAPVVTRPRFAAEAEGRLKVIVDPAAEMAKSVPAEPAARVRASPVKPLIEARRSEEHTSE